MMVLLKRNCPHGIHCIGLWLFPAEDVVRAGDCRLPWEPELVSPFTRLVRDWCLLFVVWGLVCLGFIVPYLSFWSRCLTMTILAQLNDCHCCNDAAQLSSKKKRQAAIHVKLPFTSGCQLVWSSLCHLVRCITMSSFPWLPLSSRSRKTNHARLQICNSSSIFDNIFLNQWKPVFWMKWFLQVLASETRFTIFWCDH